MKTSRSLRRPDIVKSKVSVMGVVNVTPDSFSDGGMYGDAEEAIAHGASLEKDGADIIDVGGESTRPGANEVSADEERERVIPVISALSKELRVPISIDTRKAEVAAAALEAGAKIVNDISGLRHDKDMAGIIAKHEASVILMHMKGSPKDMQNDPSYTDVMVEIIEFLKHSISLAKSAGIPDEKIIIDPGIGFGKTKEHNIEILRRLGELKKLGYPICVGLSRKSFIGSILGIDDPKKRLAGSIAANVVAAMNGADILRVHDVRETVEAMKVMAEITGATAG